MVVVVSVVLAVVVVSVVLAVVVVAVVITLVQVVLATEERSPAVRVFVSRQVSRRLVQGVLEGGVL